LRKLIIPSAGSSTRFFELGKKYPKSLLPFGNKPLITYALTKYQNQFDEITIVIKDNEDLYSEVLKYYNFKNISIKKVSSSYTQGPATSVFLGANGLEDELTVMLSDALYDFDILEMPLDSLSAMEVEDYSRWCMVDTDITFYDKPIQKPPTNLALSGVYRFSEPKIFFEVAKDYIEKSENETQLSNILEIYAKQKKLDLYKHSSEKFLDFGTVEKYIKNKNLPIGRSFNEVTFEKDWVTKQSRSNPNKILSEGLWIENFPISKNNIPKLLDIDFMEPKIKLELVNGLTLRELFLYYDNSDNLWQKLFNILKEFLRDCSKYNFESTTFWNDIYLKTSERNQGQDSEFLEYFGNLISDFNFSNESTLFHGDLVFSNIIYEPNRENIKIFDPMGSIYGHWVYDLAKVGQCVLGNYDLIDSEMYIKEKDYYKLFSIDKKLIENLFFQIFEDEIEKVSKKVFYCLIASLYLSLIPLHSHSKFNQELFYSEFQHFYKLSLSEK
jgi:dTDP-glucose pyrophosphorylase